MMGSTYGAKVRCRGIIHHEGQVLVVRQKSVVCLPGGTLEMGETPRQTITREIEEELGIAPVVGDVQVILSFDVDGKKPRIDFVYDIQNGSDYRGRDERSDASHGFELDEIMRRPITDLGDDFLPRKLVDVQQLLDRDGVLYGEVRE